MLYYLIIALKLFCIYHIYKNHKPYYWFFVVIFLPVIGGIFYIVTQVFSSKDVDKIQGEINTIVNPTKKVKNLEQKIQFADTYQSRIDLADAYYDIKDYQNAIINYQKTLEDKDQNDLYSRQQLALCYFQLEDYENVVEQAEKISSKQEFSGSKQQFCYGLALKELGRLNDAETQLKQIDRPYSNYHERLELAKFYLESGRTLEGKELLQEISTEAQYMTKPNRRIYRQTISEVERLLKAL